MRGKTVPQGFHTVTPYLLLPDVLPLIKFLEKAFDAEELEISTLDDGTVNHAQMRIGDSILMMGQAQEGYPPMPTMLYLYVDNVEGIYEQALSAGAVSLREPADEPYGDRAASVRDDFGNQYWIATPLAKA